MEAATTTARRSLEGDKAQRIVDAMRTSVASRGVARSTFDQVAREAGVSRGLLHYYFGTKERLLVEVVRRDCELRMARLDASLSGARTPDDVLERLIANLGEFVAKDPDEPTLLYELFTLSRRNPELEAEWAELVRRTRGGLAALLAAKAEEGVLQLGAPAEEVAGLMFALGDGLALRMLSDGRHDAAPTLALGARCLRPLLGA